jgi:hypothetical protein
MINKKTIISAASILTTLIVILGGLWAFEDRYAKSAEVKELETQVVQSLKQYNMQQMQMQQVYQYKNEYRFYQFLYDKLGQDMMEIRRQMRRYPEDVVLKEDYHDVQQQRNKVKDKMDDLLRKIQ